MVTGTKLEIALYRHKPRAAAKRRNVFTGEIPKGHRRISGTLSIICEIRWKLSHPIRLATKPYFLRGADLGGMFLPAIFSDATLAEGCGFGAEDGEDAGRFAEVDPDEACVLLVTDDGALAALLEKTSLASS